MSTCDCIDPAYPPTGSDVKGCRRCGNHIGHKRWRLTPEAMAAFFTAVGEGAPDIRTSGHLQHFGSVAMERAFGLGKDVYGHNDFIRRPLEGEDGKTPEDEAELLDAGNYQIFEGLKDLHSVDHGGLDPIVADEDYFDLLGITADIIRIYARVDAFHTRRRRREEADAAHRKFLEKAE